MSHFANWTLAQVEAHNSRVRMPTAASLLAEAKERETKKKTARLRAANGKLEAEIQQEIASYLDSIRAFYVWHRTDKPMTARTGTPDFVGISKGIGFAIEVKRRGFKPTVEQSGQLLHAKLEGARTGIAHSLEEAIAILNTP